MTDPLVVLFLVAANGTEPTPSSMTDSARQALGSSAVLLVEERPSLPSDIEAVLLAERLHAGALVEVDWIESGGRHALVHVHLTQGPGWADKRIDFEQGDPSTECGRTIGFSAASMITRLSAPKAIADRPTAESLPPPAAAPTTQAPPPPAPSASFPAAPTPAGVEKAKVEAHHGGAEERPSIGPATPRRVIEVVTLGALPPEGIGPSATVFGWISPSLAGQVQGGARVGELSSARGTLGYFSLDVGAGATWTALRPLASRPFEVDVRVDALATDLVVSRQGESQSRWVPDARLEVEGTWLFLANMGIVAVAGVEATIGTTDVAVGNDIVAALHPFRAIGALGVRVRF